MPSTKTESTVNDTRSAQPEEWHVLGNELAATVKNLLHEGNVRRIIIKHEGHIALEIPLTLGVVGTLVAPWLAAVGAMGALLAHYTIVVVRTDTPPTTTVAPAAEESHDGN